MFIFYDVENSKEITRFAREYMKQLVETLSKHGIEINYNTDEETL